MLQRGLNQPQPGSFLGVFCIGAIAKIAHAALSETLDAKRTFRQTGTFGSQSGWNVSLRPRKGFQCTIM
jgi:hypothetical protein